MKTAWWITIAVWVCASLGLVLLLTTPWRGCGTRREDVREDVQLIKSGHADYAWRLPAGSRAGTVLELGVIDQDNSWLTSLTDPVPIGTDARYVVVLVSGHPKVPLIREESQSIALTVMVLDQQQTVLHASTTTCENFIRPGWYIAVGVDKTGRSDVDLLGWKRELPDQKRPLILTLVARFRPPG
ncbi:MAG TPA: hypothetical protein VKD90_22105 [Gemmataceae bacterium]|nr:hypothetical protein [Gemmataceae bacterium]